MMDVTTKYKISAFLADQRKRFTKEQWTTAYQSWGWGGNGWNRVLGLGGTDTQSALTWYQFFHKPGSKEWRPSIIVAALVAAVSAPDSSLDSKPERTDGNRLHPTPSDGSASGVDRDNTAPTEPPAFVDIESGGTCAAAANAKGAQGLDAESCENSGGLDSILDSKTGGGTKGGASC